MFLNGIKFSFRFNASHSTSIIDQNRKHTHSFILNVYAKNNYRDMNRSNLFEVELKKYIKQFHGIYFNDLEEFQTVEPTVEEICRYCFEDIVLIGKNYDLEVCKVEVGDSPVALFSIATKLIVGTVYNSIREEDYNLYVNQIIKDKKYES